jgi:serine/threonine protein kinase
MQSYVKKKKSQTTKDKISIPKIDESKKREKHIEEDLNELTKKNGLKIDQKVQRPDHKISRIYYISKGPKQYALKFMYLDPDNLPIYEQQKRNFQNEMGVASNMKNKNCIKSYACFELTNSRAIIFEKAINKDLQFVMDLLYSGRLFSYLNFKKEDNSGSFKNFFIFWASETFCRFFISQLANALNYFHKVGYYHSQVCLENILLLLNFQVKLGDFSSVRMINSNEMQLNPIGDLSYQPVEVKESLKIPSKIFPRVDLYCLGICLFMMMFNKFPDQLKNSKEPNEDETFFLLKKMSRKEPIKNLERPMKYISQDLVNLFIRILEPDVFNRANDMELEHNPWISKNKEIIRKIYEYHDDDYIKFLLELQKIEFISFYNKITPTNPSKKINKKSNVKFNNKNENFIKNPHTLYYQINDKFPSKNQHGIKKSKKRFF